VQEILSQILQSLDFLHQQKFTLPSGAIQNGLIHGNLSLDTVLWAESQSQPFVYLSDLWLWEQWFDASEKLGRSTQATPDHRRQDLQAVGTIGTTLLQGLGPEPVEIAPSLRPILEALRTGKYDSAEAARRELLKLAAQSPDAIDSLDASAAQTQPASRLFSPLLALSLMGLVVGAFMLWPRLQATESRAAPARPVSTCCLKEVSAMPPGEYRYTAVQGGTWWHVLHQSSLLKRGQGLSDALKIAQPKLQLQYVPTATLDQVLAQVQAGEVDFAILPVINDLPGDLLAQEIAYDGLATVVPFSYSQRRQGLPKALQGRLSLAQVQQLYQGQINQWDQIGGTALDVKFGRRYASKNPEAIAIFEQRLLQSRQLDTLPDVNVLPAIDLLRQVIRDFEECDIGSVGFVTLSEMWGQCSIYPLALHQAGKNAVQPLVLSNGKDINPETDLCNRKGAYSPELQRFQAGQYPLSYPIMVVYPRDNRRSAIAKKFIELMRTIEGQQLLRAAGLIPVSSGLTQSAQTTGEKQKAAGEKPQEER
jgi:ABC-type molybdate transport system substrate-binding protein